MNAVRSGHQSFLLSNGTVVVVGGILGGPVEVFDPGTAFFTYKSGLGLPDHVYGGATMMPDDRVVLTGGIGAGLTGTADTLDPVAMSWQPISSTMLTPRYGHTTTLLPSGKVLICGGEDGNGVTNSAELFDPANQTFTATKTSMSVPRYTHTATQLLDGRVLIAGGYTGPAAPPLNQTSSAEIFDPVTETFTPTAGAMNYPRYEHTATLLGDGKVLIAGGRSGATPTATAEIFDPASGTFRVLSSNLSVPRALASATCLLNGCVFIAGGDGATHILNTAELFNPATQTFIPLDPFTMAAARRFFASNLLVDGGVLITGGDFNNSPIRAAEIFNCPPVFTNRTTNISAEATGPNGAALNFTVAAVDMSGHDVSVSTEPVSGSTCPLGVTHVSCMATDTRNQTTTTTFDVTVSDTTPPSITVPPTQTVPKQKGVKRGRKEGAIVTFTVGAFDLVDGPVVATASPASGSFFPLGETTVNVTATDSCGNESNRTFVVKVVTPSKFPRR